MKYVYMTLNWFFGVIFALAGLISITESPLATPILLVMAGLLLPPVRQFIFNKTNKTLSTRNRAISLIVLFFMLGLAGQYSDANKAKREAAENAAAELQVLKQDYAANHQSIIDKINGYMSAKNYTEAHTLSEKYRKVGDADFIVLADKVSKISRTDNLLREANASDVTNARKSEVYAELVGMYPDNQGYKDNQAKYAQKAAAVAEVKRKAEERKKMIESQFSAWNGSHIGLTRYIKDNMNDPDSYDHIETRYKDMGTYLIVVTKFRGKNAFGGVVLETVTAKVGLDGTVLAIL